MKIGIIDADLLGRKAHRFPNLACMKISSFYKSKGYEVILILNYDEIDDFDHIYMSKVFSDTEVPKEIFSEHNIICGGTGFFYEKAEPLDQEIEHCMPDYHLYDEWQAKALSEGVKKASLTYYNDYSIGFTTRGCFRKCDFCVNKRYDRVEKHSEIAEFLDSSRKYICLLDDNILGFKNSKEIINNLITTNKSFQFKQGLDLRLMTPEIADTLNKCKYKGDYIFAFDSMEDAILIRKKLMIWRSFCSKNTKLYVLCGFDKDEKYDETFWKKDIEDTFERIKILMGFKCLPYIMRFNRYEESPYRGTYINLARWCNQPSIFKKMSYRDFYEESARYSHKDDCSTVKYAEKFKNENKSVAEAYYDIRYATSLNESA